MKVFTSLMKTLIMIVSLALTLMLVMSAAPLIMGGVDIENTDPISIEQVDGGANIRIYGTMTVKSSLPKDIEDLEFGIDAISTKTDKPIAIEIVHVGPETVPSGGNLPVHIDSKISMAEVAMLILADNNGGTGIYLPLKIQIKAGYSGLAKIDLGMNMTVPLSDNGGISADIQKNSEGKIKTVEATIAGDAADQLSALIPNTGMSAGISIEGVSESLSLDVTKDGSGNVSININTGSEKAITDLMKEMVESGKDAKITVDSTEYTVTAEEISKMYELMEEFLGGIPDV